MHVTPDRVADEHDSLRERSAAVVPLINVVRDDLGRRFGADVSSVDRPSYRRAVDEVFDDADRAINVAALAGLLRDLDVDGDYPGFVVDDLLGRELAATIAGEQPLRLLAESTFHYADTLRDDDDAPAGVDDLDAALAAGFQTRLPGWPWRRGSGPFDREG